MQTYPLKQKLEVSGDKRKSQARDDDDYDEEPSLDRKGMRRASREVEGSWQSYLRLLQLTNLRGVFSDVIRFKFVQPIRYVIKCIAE